ncbi:MAG: Pimeloyl-ACP methyl ester carboxylesterase [uncultured Thiotrichaceae bacterium]|uniref:Pimeloyl-ACP methyl ester carboxylesterase n=1 Tax=uncultured Thiotrichaceae bacterium TaxID=298394 RepID=A0A6S6SWG9_9GAMM|nr:MAG: Pimeloyl-ACP methyl ester carboxylesterase [uncultured Thiotrichaceae bacterium]
MRKGTSLLAGLLLACSLSTAVSADEVLLEHDGISLRADLNLADDKTLADGVVMMLHGTLAHNRMEIMSTVSELLNEAGYNTLAVNLGFALDKRAEGMLDCGIEHRHRYEDAVQELTAWTDWLEKEGATKVAVWGHSRGGAQVAWFASEHDSDLLSQIILVAPATFAAASAADGYEKRYGKPLAELMSEAQKLVDAGKANEIMNVPGFVYCEDAKASAESFVSYGRADERKNTPTTLKKITKPTLVVIGSADEVVTDLAGQLSGAAQDNVRVETIEGAGHFFRDLYADDMVEVIDDFLDWE